MIHRRRTGFYRRGGEGPEVNGPFCRESLPYPRMARPIKDGIDDALAGREMTVAYGFQTSPEEINVMARDVIREYEDQIDVD